MPLLTPDSQTTTLYDAINNYQLENGSEWSRLFICAFSNSWPPFLARKRELLAVSEQLAAKGIGIILIQIHEAHSTAWPTGLSEVVQPQTCIQDRLDRANKFIQTDKPLYPVYVDTWDNTFEQTFRAWPDKYYLIDSEKKVLQKSTYGANADALIDIDCITLIRRILTD